MTSILPNLIPLFFQWTLTIVATAQGSTTYPTRTRYAEHGRRRLQVRTRCCSARGLRSTISSSAGPTTHSISSSASKALLTRSSSSINSTRRSSRSSETSGQPRGPDRVLRRVLDQRRTAHAEAGIADAAAAHQPIYGFPDRRQSRSCRGQSICLGWRWRRHLLLQPRRWPRHLRHAADEPAERRLQHRRLRRRHHAAECALFERNGVQRSQYRDARRRQPDDRAIFSTPRTPSSEFFTSTSSANSSSPTDPPCWRARSSISCSRSPSRLATPRSTGRRSSRHSTMPMAAVCRAYEIILIV